jgi:hypothetical protein
LSILLFLDITVFIERVLRLKFFNLELFYFISNLVRFLLKVKLNLFEYTLEELSPIMLLILSNRVSFHLYEIELKIVFFTLFKYRLALKFKTVIIFNQFLIVLADIMHFCSQPVQVRNHIIAFILLILKLDFHLFFYMKIR